jgi:hypothetical protein
VNTAAKSRARLTAHIADRRDPSSITHTAATHTVADVLRARMLAIGCGRESSLAV